MPASSPTDPAIAVVVSCTEPWPGLKPLLDGLLPQLAALGPGKASILVVSSVPDPVPTGWSHPAVRIATPQGASTFHLRAVGVRDTSAPIVAFTEDHVTVGDGWLAAIEQAHSGPDALPAATGPVVPPAGLGVVARAHHAYLFCLHMPPAMGPGVSTAAIANASVRRDALEDGRPTPRGSDWPPDFLLEQRLAVLSAQGKVAFVPAMQASHVQRFSLGSALRAHFHNARAVSSFTPPGPRPLSLFTGEGKRIVERAALAARALRHERPGVRGWPALVPLGPIMAATMLGRVLGWTRGGGSSPAKVH